MLRQCITITTRARAVTHCVLWLLGQKRPGRASERCLTLVTCIKTSRA